MPRYIFKKQDLEPLRPWLDTPVARRVLRSTAPVKNLRSGQVPIEETVELPVTVQSRDQPDGVPLHEVLQAIQVEMPSVVGLSVRDGKVLVRHGAAPREKDQEKLRTFIRDPKKLTAVLKRAKPNALAAPRPEDLEKLLLSDETPDAEWLSAFRRYAVANLIKTRKASK
jgi:hypothetical protein